VVWSQLTLGLSRKNSFVFGKEFLYSLLNLSCRIFGKGFINPGPQQNVQLVLRTETDPVSETSCSLTF
jgi:hypothetical protein